MHSHFLAIHVFLYKYDSFIVSIVCMYAYDLYVYTYERERERERRERKSERE